MRNVRFKSKGRQELYFVSDFHERNRQVANTHKRAARKIPLPNAPEPLPPATPQYVEHTMMSI